VPDGDRGDCCDPITGLHVLRCHAGDRGLAATVLAGRSRPGRALAGVAAPAVPGPGAFGDESEHVGLLFAAYGAMAYDSARIRARLTRAVDTRQLIG